jgi:outer membrane receptor protein involved in Fe transport
MRAISSRAASVSVLALVIAASPAAAWAQAAPAQTPPGSAESSMQDDDAAQSQAQDSDASATAAEVAAPQETGPGNNEIVVTGSRIARPEVSFPNPIQSFTAENFEQSGDTNVTDFLLDSPALVGSSNSALTAGSNAGFQEAGLNLLNLRNLGTQRTLVLVNSRRHVAAFPGTSAVDINTIPIALIERIDVLTGGASALYGADAVSGVVNFVLRRDFEGVRARGQMGISEQGDGGNRFGSIVAGRNFLDGRANITLAYDYNQSERVNEIKRRQAGDPLRRFELLPDPTQRPFLGATDDPNVPDRIFYNNVRWQDSSLAGAIDFGRVRAGMFRPGEFDFRPDFNGSGEVYDRGTIIGGSGGRTIGGTGTPTAGYFGDFLPYLERHNVNLLASYEFSPAARLFGEAKYVDSTSFTVAQPSFDFGIYLTPDNAFLRQRFGTGALTSEGAFLLGRDNFDFGVRGYRDERETLRGVIGLDGKLSDHLRYELSYVYGRSRASTLRNDDRVEDRYYAALDAVVGPNGQVTCRINLPGQTLIDENNFGEAPRTFKPGECVPLNILGEFVASPAALDFILEDHTSLSTVKQQVANAYIAGDFGFLFDLPGGPIGFALGAEYRKEQSSNLPDQKLQDDIFLDFAGQLPERGEYDVKEVFAELDLPLLRDLPFAENLTVGAAIRFSDYSTIGSTTTWNVSGTYAPIRDITFRGTYSQAVRAPNINELFAPLAGAFSFITDPCDISNRPNGSQFRAANCVAQLAALGLTPAQIANFSPSSDAEASTSRPGSIGGNPELNEETAKTFTAGIVLRPRFLPGFSLSVDYYDIRLRDAINTFTATQAFSLCVDQPTLDNPFCALIERNPTTGFAADYTLTPQNVAQFKTRGVDAILNYRFTPGDGDLGTFNIRAVGGYLRNLTFINTPGADPDEDQGELNPNAAPKFLGTLDLTWTTGPVTLNYGLAWQSQVRRFTREQLRANPDAAAPKFIYYKERWEHDIQLAYAVNDDFSFYGGINNFTNQKPSIGSTSYPTSPIGRYYYFGVRTTLGGLLGM